MGDRAGHRAGAIRRHERRVVCDFGERREAARQRSTVRCEALDEAKPFSHTLRDERVERREVLRQELADLRDQLGHAASARSLDQLPSDPLKAKLDQMIRDPGGGEGDRYGHQRGKRRRIDDREREREQEYSRAAVGEGNVECAIGEDHSASGLDVAVAAYVAAAILGQLQLALIVDQ